MNDPASRPDCHSDRERLASWYSARLDDSKRRGIPISKLASELGITSKTLYRWKQRLSQAPLSEGKASSLIRVRIQSGGESQESPFPLKLGLAKGRWLEIPVGFDAQHLQRVLEALEAC